MKGRIAKIVYDTGSRLFQASVNFNERNTIWQEDLYNCLSTCQSCLRYNKYI